MSLEKGRPGGLHTRRSVLGAFGAGAAAVALGLSAPRPGRAGPSPLAPAFVDPIGDGGLVVMGWDGAGWNNVAPMLAEGRLPNLQALIADGAHVLPVELIGRTNTIATWSQLFTALSYDQSGAAGNRHGLGNIAPNAPKGSAPQLNFWSRVFPYRWTVPYQAQTHGARVGWITSKGYLGRNREETPLAKVARLADHFVMRSPSHGGPEEYIDELTLESEAFVQPGGSFFLFLHVNPDYYGHRYGEASDRYRDEFVRADTALGRVRAAAPGAHFLITTDHGFDPGGHNHYHAPDAWAVTTLPVHPDFFMQPAQRAFATPRDLASTMLEIYGADLKTRWPQIRGKRLLA